MIMRKIAKGAVVYTTITAFSCFYLFGGLTVAAESKSDNSGNIESQPKQMMSLYQDKSDNEKTKNYRSVNKLEKHIRKKNKSKLYGKKEAGNYIVKFKNKKTYNTVKDEYETSGDISKNAENRLKVNYMLPVDLSGKEVKDIEAEKGIEYIEEDYIVTGCGKKDDSDKKSKKKDKKEEKENKKAEKEKNKKKKHEKKEKRLKKNESKHEWNLRMINAEGKAQKEVDSEKRVKVAVIDSGIDWGNDINLAYQVSLVPGEEEMTQIFMDGNGHGSSVASLIAAENNDDGITGINPNVDIYSYRVLDEKNGSPVSRVVEAIYMAIEQQVNIINMSFGLKEHSYALEEAVNAAKDAGILVVAAAGNCGEEGVQYPAAYDDVMAVGAVNKYGDVEDYSAKGEELEIVAPGELIRTTGFIDSDEVTSGTSLSAPQVSAVASLIWEKDLSVSADFVRGLLDASANLYGDKEAY